MKGEKENVEIPPKFKFLDDSCSSVDLTEDKTHQRIADQLFELIESGDSKGLTIGLEGDWGSGKSTVIELLRQKLEKDEKTFFFYIDTWAHEGDPLRRAFLDSLIAQLKNSPSLSDESKQELNILSARIANRAASKKIVRHSKPQKFGSDMGKAALFVPVGTAIVGAFAPQVTWHWTGRICLEFWMGVALALAPLWVFLFYRATKRDRSLFSLESTEDVTYETSLEEERSSVEFARYFDEIVRIVHPRFPKIVMVIDNLDRIDQKDALRIWSTLQTFMQRKNPHGSEGKSASRWIIVPYAQEGLEKIWSQGSSDRIGANEREQTTALQLSAFQKDIRQSSFMDKSFDLRIHVPKMVIGDWHTFAKQCIHEAAPNLPPQDAETILNVLSATYAKAGDALSPRQIKLYVNHVGVAWRFHAANATLGVVCFYVILRYLKGMSDSDIEQRIIGGKAYHDSIPLYVSPRPEEVAAVMYGVPEKKAMQLVLGQIIEEGLKKSETDALRHWRSTFGEEVFDTVAGHIVDRSKFPVLPTYMAAIQKAFPSGGSKLCQQAFQRLQANRFNSETIFSNVNHDDAMALLQLASSNKDAELAGKLAETYVQRLLAIFARSKGASAKSIPEEDRIENGKLFIARLKQVPDAAGQEIKISYVALEDKKFPFQRLDEDAMEELAGFLDNPDDADAYLSQYITGIVVGEWMVVWLSALIRHGMRRMDNILKAIGEELDPEHHHGTLTIGDKDHHVWELLLALDILPVNESPVVFIQEMLRSSVLEGTADFSHPGLIYLLAKYRGEELTDDHISLRHTNPDFAYYAKAWSASDPELGKKVYIYSARSGEYEWLASEAARPNRELARDIIQAAVEDGEKRLFDVSSPFKFLVDAWNWTEDRVHDALLDNFVSSEQRLESLGKSSEKITEHPQMCRILLERCKTMAVQKPLVDKCLVELRRVTQEKWEQDFGDPSLVKLVVYLQKMGASANLGLEFYSAFKGLLADALDEGYVPGLKFDELASLYHAMDSTFHTPFGGTVGRKLLDCKFAVVGGDFARFLVDVPDYSEWLNEKPSEILDALAELAQEEDLAPLFRFASLLARHRDRISYWAKVKNATRPFVEQLLQDSTKEKRTWGQKIAQALDVTEEKPSGEKGETKQKGGAETEATREGRA